MLTRPSPPVPVPVLLLLLLPPPGAEPWSPEVAIRCPLCSEERRGGCKVPVGCEELVRESGCGCCATCALSRGSACGVYTSRCGSGLRCFPRTGAHKPLHSLIHGHGVCMEPSDIQQVRVTLPRPENEDYWEPELTESSHIRCHTHDKKCIARYWARIREKSHSSSRSKNISPSLSRDEPQIMGPCYGELQRAVERFAMSQGQSPEDLYNIPIPNCDRKGYFHSKQCHPSMHGQRGKCWCVDPKTGMKMASRAEVTGEVDCQRALAEQTSE
ncbi:insulin-like growth factor-binding protein 4 [Callorhinchus milii]|nr:insulin-like growth factor-binding protein 4 [Callorhinchus milii]|eukprot:gi/632967055/ref/XP_007899760.1/ PREDICTED: insulin-like growth factor-binding protein 4 [Callorhinchus milii]